MNHKRLGEAFESTKGTDVSLEIQAFAPNGYRVQGPVIGRGSKYAIQDPSRGLVEDIEAASIYNAYLIDRSGTIIEYLRGTP